MKKGDKMKKVRNSNIEVLRIISIILIVISHYSVHNGIRYNDMTIGLNRFILEISMLGNIGTIIFVSISGYFLIDTNRIKLEKILKLLMQIMFYSITIYIILVLMNKKDFSIVSLLKNCLPITFKKYWFASTYFILYLFTPFINKFIKNLSRNEHLEYIILSLFIFSILNTLTGQDYYGNELVQFIIFYSIGSYMKLYPDNKLNNNSVKIFIVSAILIAISIITMDLLGAPFANHSTYLLKRTSLLTIAISTSLLSIFSQKKPFSNKIINDISSCTFGIYLISDNCYMRAILWKDIFKNSNFISSNYLLIHMILTILIVITSCIIIDKIRKEILEKPIFKILKKKITFIEEKIDSLSNLNQIGNK